MHTRYPFFQNCGNRGILPNITLPENFRELIPDFYQRGGKEKIEDIVEIFNKHNSDRVFPASEIRISWSETDGLTHISMGHGGLDLNPHSRFQEHNLGTESGLYVGAIAITYIHEMLKPTQS